MKDRESKTDAQVVGLIGDEDVYLPASFSPHIKEHQLEGLQFMWRNIISKMHSDAAAGQISPSYGVVLAHSMGLGKTFQVIAFVTTLLLNFKKIKLPNRRVLIVCPNTLTTSWENEFRRWLDDRVETVGRIFVISIFFFPQNKKSGNSQQGPHFISFFLSFFLDKQLRKEKMTLLQTWNQVGGVFIVGYHGFRVMCKEAQNSEYSAIFDLAFVKPGPSLVVCDEAHVIKNSASQVAQALKKLTCSRRICLTGYPLQNNLNEYWCMFDFVQPGFLGSYPEFKKNYEAPIEQGLGQDASPADVRKSKRSLLKLITTVSKILHRKDAQTLEKQLPPKHEFVVTCRLSEIQRKIYEAFIVETDSTLFASLVASLLSAHPTVLKVRRGLCSACFFSSHAHTQNVLILLLQMSRDSCFEKKDRGQRKANLEKDEANPEKDEGMLVDDVEPVR